MSSQGPNVNTSATVAEPPFCVGPTSGTPDIGKGYVFTTAAIRDGSDWIAYKKQSLIRKEDKTKINQDPWFSRGNDYRLQFLQGVYKFGPVDSTACTGCSSGTFDQNGAY